MAVEQLKQMIANVTADIRLYQKHLGAHIVHVPSSEAYRLCDVKLSLERELANLRWCCK